MCVLDSAHGYANVCVFSTHRSDDSVRNRWKRLKEEDVESGEDAIDESGERGGQAGGSHGEGETSSQRDMQKLGWGGKRHAKAASDAPPKKIARTASSQTSVRECTNHIAIT